MQFSLLNLKRQLFVKLKLFSERSEKDGFAVRKLSKLYGAFQLAFQTMPGIGGLFRGRPMSVFRPQWTDIDGAHQTALMPGGLERGNSRGFPSFLFNSFSLTKRINSSLTLFCPQSTWMWFYCSWPQGRRRRINWGRDRVMDFSRREGYRTNLCRNGGEFLRSAVPSANASALFINNEEVSAVNIKKPPGSHPHKSHSLSREMWSSFIMIFFPGHRIRFLFCCLGQHD